MCLVFYFYSLRVSTLAPKKKDVSDVDGFNKALVGI